MLLPGDILFPELLPDLYTDQVSSRDLRKPQAKSSEWWPLEFVGSAQVGGRREPSVSFITGISYFKISYVRMHVCMQSHCEKIHTT